MRCCACVRDKSGVWLEIVDGERLRTDCPSQALCLCTIVVKAVAMSKGKMPCANRLHTSSYGNAGVNQVHEHRASDSAVCNAP